MKKEEERDLYNESYWQSVGRKPPKGWKGFYGQKVTKTKTGQVKKSAETPQNKGGRPKGSKDSYQRTRSVSNAAD